MKYAYLLLFTLLAFASCSSHDEVLEVPTPENTQQQTLGYNFTIDVGEPTTRVIYHDNIGPEHSAYNPNANGTNKLTMSWEKGDELVAIRWSGNYDEYVVLTASLQEGEEATRAVFNANQTFNSPLTEGERFVLVHGDFVLDPDKANNYKDPKLDFPTSQVTKTGYADYIRHGGVVEGKDLTFRNQDGTLQNLRKHEYMVTDAYVHFTGESDANGNEKVTFLSKEGTTPVKMNIAHTLLRLTLFLPDEMFNNSNETDLIAVSLKDAALNKIFHRYFRMHPSEKKPEGEPNYYKTTYNDNADHEENPYIRINLMDEDKLGVDHTIENVFGSATFNRKKPVSVKGNLSGKDGHYFTLYFSLPSRHMGVEGSKDPSDLKVTVFTRTHAHTTANTSAKAYHLPDAAMKPGMVVPLNVNFVNNDVPIKAITDPELGISFTPGFVYANKNADGTWTYGVYENQGEYAGMSHQTLSFGEYFTFGSKDPTDAFHKIGTTDYPAKVPEPFVDVASLAQKNGVSGLYQMLTLAEAERLMARFKAEVAKNGLFLGYYFYEGEGNTIHKAPGSHNDAILTAAAAGSKTKEELEAMSASLGIYVGRSTQPKYEEQDDYFFLPHAGLLIKHLIA